MPYTLCKNYLILSLGYGSADELAVCLLSCGHLEVAPTGLLVFFWDDDAERLAFLVEIGSVDVENFGGPREVPFVSN